MKQEVNWALPVRASFEEIRDLLFIYIESVIDFWKHDWVRLRQ